MIDALTGRAVLGGLGLSDVWVSEWAGGFGGRDLRWVYFEDVMGHPPADASAGAASRASGPQVSNDSVP